MLIGSSSPTAGLQAEKYGANIFVVDGVGIGANASSRRSLSR
jgi:hypothetical protein